MKTSTPSSPKPRDPLSILLIGPPGGGKTTLSMQFPSVYFINCDENLDGPELFVRSKLNKDLSYAYDTIRVDDEGKSVPIGKCFDRVMDKLSAIGKEDSVKTVVVDGLTHINEFSIQKILLEQRIGEMSARNWQPFKSNMLALLVGRLRSLGKTTICTCHEVIISEPDKVGGKDQVMKEHIVGYKPAVQGGIVDYFGGFFTDMWRCHAMQGVGPGVVEYKLDFNRTNQSDLKNSIGLPSEGFKIKSNESMFDKLKPFLNGRV